MDQRDMPQIGSFAIEPDVMAAPGERLTDLLARLSGAFDIDGASDESQELPVDGWRTLSRKHGLLLGAPIDAEKTSWRVAHLEDAAPDRPNGRLRIHPNRLPMRPSRRERARGLSLRWPEVTTSEPDLDQLWIDIVNDGDQRWHPNGDRFHVAAAIARPGHDGAGFALIAGRDGAAPLDPGEYARVRATLDPSGLDELEPGPHDVHAWLVDLSIRTLEPLRVEITPEALAKRRAAVAQRPPRPDDAAGLRSRIAMLNTLLKARGRLREIVDILLEPSTRPEQSVDRVAALLGCSRADAQAVLSTGLRRFDIERDDRTARELAEVERALRERSTS